MSSLPVAIGTNTRRTAAATLAAAMTYVPLRLAATACDLHGDVAAFTHVNWAAGVRWVSETA